MSASTSGEPSTAAARGLVLSGEQRQAFAHVTGKEGLAAVVGYAGSGKSAMLGVARGAWEAAGYTVRGAALSGIAAEVRAVAERRGVAVSTLRTQVAAILAKTATTRQAELVALVLRAIG